MESLAALKAQIEEFHLIRSSERDKYPKEIKEEVKKLVASGYSPSQLSEALQVSQDSIRSWSGKRKYIRRKFKEAKLVSNPRVRGGTIEVRLTRGDWCIRLELEEGQHKFLRDLLYAL